MWFSNDLRIDDNQTLARAAKHCDHLVCIYIIDASWFKPNRYGLKTIGEHRWRFLNESLMDLLHQLKSKNQELLIFHESTLKSIYQCIEKYNIDAVYQSCHAGFYENKQWNNVRQRFPNLHFEQVDTHTLFNKENLPITLNELKGGLSFSKFRKKVENAYPKLLFSSSSILYNDKSLRAINKLPPPPQHLKFNIPNLPTTGIKKELSNLKGGAMEGHKQVREYFNSRQASQYKLDRNALDGWKNSTKFSPWLANGCLSVKQIFNELDVYETNHGRNESTYWIKFELLWREYFQWLSHANDYQLFNRTGLQKVKILNSFYPERFKRWTSGNTPYPLVNACMNQLNQTGYISNRGRQIVASYLVNELEMDWRYGAAYFEQQLIDYDVAANWGNWQYLAGVGTDLRGKRHFDINKQTQLYDAHGLFMKKWGGQTNELPLDSVDAADWPIDCAKNNKSSA
jgi:deoxyribodipyrimidine photo-lyase